MKQTLLKAGMRFTATIGDGTVYEIFDIVNDRVTVAWHDGYDHKVEYDLSIAQGYLDEGQWKLTKRKLKQPAEKVYTGEPIEVNGTVVRFDGKWRKVDNTLKVYRYYGDINLQGEAMQNFAIENGIGAVKIIIR